jgi:hypothetical protein
MKKIYLFIKTNNDTYNDDEYIKSFDILNMKLKYVSVRCFKSFL